MSHDGSLLKWRSVAAADFTPSETLLHKLMLDPRVGYQPHDSDHDIDGAGDPGIHKRKRNRYRIQDYRCNALVVPAQCPRQRRVIAMLRDQDASQNVIRDTGHEQHDAVERDRT